MIYENYRTYVSSRILSHSVKVDNGCIVYGGDKYLVHEYGLVSITIEGKRKSVPAHRAMWMAINDRFYIPRNIVIRHTCDNPRCVNIEHLVHGTQKDNCDDKFARGRQRTVETYVLHTRKRLFTNDTILAIKSAKGKLKLIAEEFGTTPGYVSKLKNGKAKTLVV